MLDIVKSDSMLKQHALLEFRHLLDTYRVGRSSEEAKKCQRAWNAALEVFYSCYLMKYDHEPVQFREIFDAITLWEEETEIWRDKSEKEICDLVPITLPPAQTDAE